MGGHEADGVLSRKNVLRQQTAALERGGDLCLETGALVQREQRRVLNVPGHAIGRVGRQIGQMLDRIHGPDDPAAARPSHRVAFRHRPHDQSMLRHPVQRARREMRTLPDLRVVNLVRDQPHVVIAADLRDAFKRFAGIDNAGGVVGRVHQQRRGVGLFRSGGNHVRTGLERIFRTGGDRMGQGADTADRTGVGGVIGIDIKRCIAGVAGRHMRGKQRALTTRRDQHIVARRRHTGTFLQPRGHGIAQTRGAGDGRIPCVTGQSGAVHILQDRCGGADVMFANRQLCHLRTLFNHLAGAQENAPAV